MINKKQGKKQIVDKKNAKNSKKKVVKKESENKYLRTISRIWDYIWNDDSAGSYVANFLFAVILIKFILFPILGLVFHTDYPVVAIVSGSMEHKIVNNKICDKGYVGVSYKDLDFDEYWNNCGDYYEKEFNLTKDTFLEFDYKNGLNTGDMMVLYGTKPKNIELGDVLVFVPGDFIWYSQNGPVIHRVIKKWTDDNGKYHFSTKGDHNVNSINYREFENDITEERVLGTAVLRVRYLGYIKVAINNGIMKVKEFF